MSDGDGGCDAGTPFGVVFILEAGLRWEGVGFQPFEQRHVQAVAQVHELRGMGVGVHHAWNEKASTRQLDELHLGVVQFVFVAEGGAVGDVLAGVDE